jgi:uncharacterized protein YcbX
MSKSAGRVTQIWRYPVKSMGGESLDKCSIASNGIPGDRGWATRDETAKEIRGAKKIPALLTMSARYLSEPTERAVPPAEISTASGATLRTDDPRINERLSELVGRRVSLWPLQPATDTEHYKRNFAPGIDMMAEMREVFGRLESEPLPNIAAMPAEVQELMAYTSPLGTYFDAYPIHLVTTSSLEKLESLTPGSRFDVRRFRPNFVVEGAEPGLVEQSWVGKKLRIGEAELSLELGCFRCVMTTLPQADLPKDPKVLRTIVRDADQNVGVYAKVTKPGAVRIGDAIEVLG